MAVHSTAKAAVFIWCGHKLVSITVARYNELRASNAQCGLLPYNKSLPCPVTTTGHPDSLLYKYAQGSSQTDCSCRRFLLEWLSFLYRYVPVGLLEVVPQCMQWRPPAFFGRSDLETLLASDNAADWVRISEMLLGPPPANFSFAPKHKSNAYARSETEMAQAHEAEQENG